MALKKSGLLLSKQPFIAATWNVVVPTSLRCCCCPHSLYHIIEWEKIRDDDDKPIYNMPPPATSIDNTDYAAQARSKGHFFFLLRVFFQKIRILPHKLFPIYHLCISARCLSWYMSLCKFLYAYDCGLKWNFPAHASITSASALSILFIHKTNPKMVCFLLLCLATS